MPDLDSDGVIVNEFKYSAHEDKLYAHQTQPSEKIILDRNAELRKNKGALKNLVGKDGKEWGGLQANIPNIMYYKVLAEGKYNLNNDADLDRWLKETVEGRACLIH